jgi:hypothetical protein
MESPDSGRAGEDRPAATTYNAWEILLTVATIYKREGAGAEIGNVL